MRRNRALAAAAIVALTLSAGWLTLPTEPGGVPRAQAQNAAGGPVPVEVARVETDTVVEQASAVGTLLSDESVVVRPEIAGRITGIHFEEGEPVEAGALLFSLKDSVLQAELADAKARLQVARRNYERAEELYDRGAGTARARDEALGEYERAQAAVELARARLEETDIEAPFSGLVGLRRVSVGDYVTAGQALVNLESIEPLKVDFSIPERFLGALEESQTIKVAADAFPAESFEGKVYAIDPKIDPAGRSIRVRARLPNAERRLRPGLFVRVKLQLARRENAPIVPEQAIVPRGEDRYVFKVEDGKAVLTRVEIGQRRYGRAEILKGLQEGDVVVTAGQLKIQDGAAVKVLDRPRRDGQPAAGGAQGDRPGS